MIWHNPPGVTASTSDGATAQEALERLGGVPLPGADGAECSLSVLKQARVRSW